MANEKIRFLSCQKHEREGEKYVSEDGRIFRRISRKNKNEFLALFRCGLIEELTKKKLIPGMTVIDETNDSEYMIIEEEQIPYVIHPYEWSFYMLYAAGICVLRTNLTALQYGYQLMDPHAYNVVFMGTNPVYVDLGSFEKVTVGTRAYNWAGYHTFLQNFVYPLRIASNRYGLSAPAVAQRVMGMVCNSIDMKEYMHLFSKCPPFLTDLCYSIVNSLQSYYSVIGKRKIPNICAHYEKQTEGLVKLLDRYCFSDVGVWSNYQADYLVGECIKKNTRWDCLCELLGKLDIETSYEIGGNQGLFSSLLLQRGIVQRALCTDSDRGAIDTGVKRNVGNRNLYYAVYNILDETEIGGEGMRRHERFKSDIVIALALTHHLILTKRVRLQFLFELLSKYTMKYILIEFMPLGLDKVRGKVPRWYTLEWFKSEMSVWFDILDEIQTGRNRIAILGKLR